MLPPLAAAVNLSCGHVLQMRILSYKTDSVCSLIPSAVVIVVARSREWQLVVERQERMALLRAWGLQCGSRARRVRLLPAPCKYPTNNIIFIVVVSRGSKCVHVHYVSSSLRIDDHVVIMYMSLISASRWRIPWRHQSTHDVTAHAPTCLLLQVNKHCLQSVERCCTFPHHMYRVYTKYPSTNWFCTFRIIVIIENNVCMYMY